MNQPGIIYTSSNMIKRIKDFLDKQGVIKYSMISINRLPEGEGFKDIIAVLNYDFKVISTFPFFDVFPIGWEKDYISCQKKDQKN